jgi:hypothetical protein
MTDMLTVSLWGKTHMILLFKAYPQWYDTLCSVALCQDVATSEKLYITVFYA